MKNDKALFRVQILCLLVAVFGLCQKKVEAQTAAVNSLGSFTGGNNGNYPYAGLALGADGNFYGTTEYGGVSNCGTVFRLTPAGKLTYLSSFTGINGNGPHAQLTLGPNGNFYSTTYEGGSNNDGTVYEVTTNGLITPLASFANTNGANPWDSLLLATDGNFYGTTEYGGVDNDGTVFRVTTNGVLTSLVSFMLTNGQYPVAGLTLGPDGNLYGTTVGGGSNNYGTVFNVTTSGGLTSLASFNNTNGANPWGWLTFAPDNNFYGTTLNGGPGSLPYGTVFRISTNGAISSLVSFDFGNGKGPTAGLTLDAYGNLYGTTTYGGVNSGSPGTIFQVTTNGGFTTLFNFAFIGNNDGGNPFGALVSDGHGDFYGSAYQGGQYGQGAVFVLSFPLVIQSQPQSGGNLKLSLQTIPGHRYSVQQTPGISENNWSIYSQFTATGGPVQITIPMTNGPIQFFRVSEP